MAKFHKECFLTLCIMALFIFTNAQDNNLLITTTYLNKEQSKKVSYWSSNMNILKEEYYYVPNNSIVAIVEYDNKQKIQKFIGFDKKLIFLLIDYKNGKYLDYENETYLNFKENFEFDGIQKSRNLICNYKNGKREGSYIQYHSDVSGQNIVSVKRPDIELLQKNIITYYDELNAMNTYKRYEAIRLNFNNDSLNGYQSGKYFSGSSKFISEFKNGKLINYVSFENDKSINTKISTIDGVLSKLYIENGQLINDSKPKICFIPELMQAGEILLSDSIRKKETVSDDDYENSLPDRDDLEFFEFSYSGNEEKEMAKKIIKEKKIPTYYITNVRILTRGDYKIHFNPISKL